MLKNNIILFIAITLSLIFTNNAQARLYSAYVANFSSGKVISQYNSAAKNYPASLTKIMTLYILFKKLKSKKLKLNSLIRISRNATRVVPSKLGLKAGDFISVKNAILAITVHSANDIAIAIAEKVSGNVKSFVKDMNSTARSLKMYHTNFSNPTGLFSYNNYTTARDLALLSRAIYKKFPQYYKYFSTKTFTYRHKTYYNHNHILFAQRNIEGMKTGYTSKSGFNIILIGKQKGQRVITIVLGGQTSKWRDRQATYLLKAGFRQIKKIQLIKTKRASSKSKIQKYAIQIGVFLSHYSATNVLNKIAFIKNALKEGRKKIATEVRSNRTLYKAQISNLSKATAYNTCQKLKNNNLECFVITQNPTS